MARRRVIPGYYFLPLAAVSTTLLALFALFLVMITQQNRLSEERELEQLEAAVDARIGFLQSNLRDYSRWTDALEHLALPGPVDSRWANENLGPYLYRTKGYERAFVVDTQGRSLYATYLDRDRQESADSALGDELQRIIGRLNAAQSGVETPYTSITSIQGKPVAIAASVILPNIGENYNQPYERRYLIFVQPIDREFVASIAASHRLTGIDLGDGQGQPLAVSMPLKNPVGETVGYLHWHASRPGDAMARSYLPILGLITVLALALLFSVIRNTTRMTRELAASEAHARHLANHDTLTGLPNRRAMRERGMRAETSSSRAMLYLDLDGFKEVNDLFGHQAGDVLLKEATARLQAVVGKTGLLARVGGDEFAILLTGGRSHELAVELAQAIVEVMSRPFESNEIRMVVSASVGVALGSREQGIDDLARFADVAMYSAKADGKNCWRVYMPSMDEGREVRKLLESELRDDIEAGNIDVMFQPILDAREGMFGTVEALARWTSPSQGPVGPAIFVPIAEESGLIVRMGELVLRKACIAARDWDVNLAVNISPAQFWHGTLVEDIIAILRECNFPPERLELEITEGYLLSRPELAGDVIARIRSHGIRVALDDFGTGFASIGYLRRFALDRLKLDRSFVEMVDRDAEAASVTKAVIGLSHALKLPITAEGVETGAQAIFMTIAGCERLQGWHYGKAMTGAEISAMLARRETDEVRRAILS